MSTARAVLTAVVAVVGIWGITYGFVWMAQSGCAGNFTLACNSALPEAAAKFIMLGWVSDYQTLLAGILAVVAGAFVFVATAMQRASAAEDEKLRRRQAIVQSFATLKAEFTRARVMLMNTRDSVSQSDADMSSARACIPTIATFDGWFCEVLTLAIRYTEKALRVRSEPRGHARTFLAAKYTMEQESEIRAGLAYATIMNFYLREPELIVSPEGRPSGYKVERKHVAAALRGSDLSWDEAPLLETLFEEK